MTVYIPASFCEEDYRPSWTGNYTYSTVTIRGIFDSLEKAEQAIENWSCADDCTILEREVSDESSSFDISLDEDSFTVWTAERGYYGLNEIVDEEYSAIYDENQDLGVNDW
jgi:hypothetical protein